MSAHLNSQGLELPGLDPVARCATAAAATVSDEIAALAREHGRAGLMVCLRQRSNDLSRSALAEDQIRSSAFEAAADDVAWGRPPLRVWLQEMCDPAAASETGRAAIRATLPRLCRDITSPAQALLREIEARCARRVTDEFDAVSERADYLEAVRALQARAFDDPRLRAPPALRAVMRCSADLLLPLIRPGTGVAAGEGSPASPARRGDWRRLLRWRTWIAGGARLRNGDSMARPGDP